MFDGRRQGEPVAGDRGLDRTHTWGRTYWGGALFCLVADINIRKQTGNKKGLQDALRAIVAAGGTIDHDWPLMKALEVGDKATGATVLTDQYKQWSTNPMPVDLAKLWTELGVSAGGEGASFNPSAPLAHIREAITRR
jgi:predicted metalloprotease with PDZ domain